MKIEFHKALGGVEYINKVAKEKRDIVILLLLFQQLLEDPEMTLKVHDRKKLKGFKEKVYEIRKEDYRIFYLLDDDCMHILDIIKKKKNYTEMKYINLLKKRVKEI